MMICDKISAWFGVLHSYRPLPHCLVLLVGLRELRGVTNLLSKLVGLSCVMSTKMIFAKPTGVPTHRKFTHYIDLIDKNL